MHTIIMRREEKRTELMRWSQLKKQSICPRSGEKPI